MPKTRALINLDSEFSVLFILDDIAIATDLYLLPASHPASFPTALFSALQGLVTCLCGVSHADMVWAGHGHWGKDADVSTHELRKLGVQLRLG